LKSPGSPGLFVYAETAMRSVAVIATVIRSVAVRMIDDASLQRCASSALLSALDRSPDRNAHAQAQPEVLR